MFHRFVANRRQLLEGKRGLRPVPAMFVRPWVSTPAFDLHQNISPLSSSMPSFHPAAPPPPPPSQFFSPCHSFFLFAVPTLGDKKPSTSTLLASQSGLFAGLKAAPPQVRPGLSELCEGKEAGGRRQRLSLLDDLHEESVRMKKKTRSQICATRINFLHTLKCSSRKTMRV